MDFNEIWHQQYSYIGVIYALHLISKHLRGKFLEPQFFLHQQVHKSVDDQNCVKYYFERIHPMHFPVK